MPTYEYVCNQCSHRFETWQKMSDDPLDTCPKCGQNIRRVLFPAGIVFKGSGFYKTDHAKGSAPAAENGHTPKSDEAASTKEGESKPAATESKSSESKPAESSSGTSGQNKVTVEAK